ncbi:MAG: TonB-dependent receptor [Verrucomicrobia bacterium]|nr:TonB-dependent receptor [Verrucomicrobiota bacterium]
MTRSLRPIAVLLALLPPLAAQVATEAPTKLAEFVVTPSRFGVADVATTAAASLTAAELEVLPQVGDDLFRSIARLPGLAADDVSAQFWVRGAPHSELLARLDGVDLIEPFHLKDVDGALSIVDPAVIRWLELGTGGFGAEYGDRLAGVLTMETKSETRPLTALNLSLTGLGATKQGTFAGNRGRWLATARRGYPDIALRASGRDDDVSPRYYDAMAKVEYDVAPAHTVSLHLLHAGDGLRYVRTNSPSLSSSYDSDYAWARWRGEATPKLRGEAVLSWTRLTWNRNGSGRLDGFPFSLRDHRRLTSTALRNDWTYQAGEAAILHAGLEARSGEARYDYDLRHQRTGVANGVQVVVTETENALLSPDGTSLGAFASVKFRPVAPLVIEPGLRFDRHDHVGDDQLEPRLNAALALAGTTVRAAWGGYTQAPGLQDIAVADGERRFGRIERAEHRVLGVERPLGARAAVRLEAYERITTRVRPRWENLDNAYDLFPEAQSDRVLFAPDRARARGVELLFSSRGQSRWQWHVSYALARTEERLANRWVPRARDQEHSFYADVTYAPNSRWQFSAAWHFHTGWPTTDVVYSLSTLNNGRRLLVSTNGPAYGLRLPDYHRLDLRATRRFKLRLGELRAFIDLFNAYDRTNILGYDHNVSVSGTTVTDRRKAREQLPFLPSVGVSWEF